jgi:hypothetical protein
MKKLLFIYFTTVLFLNQTAQVEFCPSGAHWTTAFNSGGFPQSLSYNYEVYANSMGKDTLNGDSVKVLLSSRFFMNGSNCNSDPIYLKQIGDTVFMNTIYTNNQWQVLFNFGATTGQKWYDSLRPYTGLPIVSYTNTVMSTQTVLINGFTLKQLVVAQESNGEEYDRLINYTLTERIGSNKFVFSFGGASNPDGDSFLGNLCYYDDAFGTYYYGGSSCVLTTGIEKINSKALEIKLFPNPTKDNLSIQYGEINNTNNYSYIILNALGEKVKEGNLNFQEMEADLITSDLACGIYILKLQDSTSSNKVASKRFVKMN